MAFTTRFLASDGIPEYNALLDQHLGRHRNRLLGSKASLELLEKTGAISKVAPGRSADQYVVYIDSPKVSASQPQAQQQSQRKPKPATQTSTRTVPAKRVVKRRATEKIEPLSDRPSPPLVASSSLLRSASDSFIRQAQNTSRRPATSQKRAAKPVVNHLLESDVAFHEKINRYKAQIAALDEEKLRIQEEITRRRKALCGVNAVHDNDMAVAHCHAVMQHRLSKAQEEYMKVLTHQASIRADIDVARRELLAMSQVRCKLETDVAEANQKISNAEDRINTTRNAQKSTFAELSTLERQAEADAVERILKLPPEDDMVNMDIPKFMQSIHDRALLRKEELERAKAATLQAAIPPSNPLCDFDPIYRDAFQAIKQAVTVPPTVNEFVDTFVETENQILSMYAHQQVLQAELKKAQQELESLQVQARVAKQQLQKQRDDATSWKTHLQEKIALVRRKTTEYESLHGNQKHDEIVLRSSILHLLEVLKADKLILHSNGMVNHVQDLPLPTILGIAQERIVDVIIHVQQTKGTSGIATTTVQIHPRSHHARRSPSMETPSLVGKVVVGPRIPPAYTGSNLPSFEAMANATALPDLLNAESSVDHAFVPLSSYQLFERALRNDDVDQDE
ncbi:unnamed protein product [Aphanomyces euteiches]|nr:hypothetical protein Ae201684P_012447 [Aphanomyces euteiches]